MGVVNRVVTGRDSVLARSGTILHSNSGVCIETPLLVPAFSSKGFMLPDGTSEIEQILLTTAEFLTGVYLISAYDVHYQHVPIPGELPVRPEMIIVDSGGYEVSGNYDHSAVNRSTPEGRPWSRNMMESVVKQWPEELPTIFVSYDHPDERRPVPDQIAMAVQLRKMQQNQLHCFLLKPENSTQRTLDNALKAVSPIADELRAFDVIGVTEKELGRSHLQRMVQIARLRRTLDEAKVEAPIHIFGALDPISACLYFLSGAEVFDGLTWLRYAFVEDRCVYVHNHAVLEFGVQSRDADLRLRVLSHNYYYLEQLQEQMKDYQYNGDWAKLPHSDLLKDAYERLERSLSKGGR